MKTYAKMHPPEPPWVALSRDALSLTDACLGRNPVPSSRFPCSEYKLLRHDASSLAGTRETLIYAVDDLQELTELYTRSLEAAGYTVKAFNDRTEALAALKAARPKPDLLITDYLGLSMPIGHFILRCRLVHPSLRILVASGLNQADVAVSQVRLDRFIQKPFTLDELQQEVRATLNKDLQTTSGMGSPSD